MLKSSPVLIYQKENIMKIINKILFVSLLAGAVITTGCGSEPPAPQAQPSAVESADMKPADVKIDGNAAGTNISLPGGIKIQTGEGGAKVNLPGINIDTTETGAKVSMPGVEVTTEGDKATVNMPGMSVTSDGANSNVDMGEIKVNTDGTDSNVSVGDMKIDVKDGETTIQTPDSGEKTNTDAE
ncbi:MAG: hypothetical protein A2W80_16795 [Candidatus Riflebacteria bacterium GWC2_50_8]|nr:MAG: hypothetical protein A2W80_16795 [Candidatus Riflebacteria bacterium GWC2_50_8]